MRWYQTIFVFGLAMFPSIALAGVIDEAQPLTVSLTKVLNFLLLIFGAIGILGMVVAGFMYFTAGGDERQMLLAKKAWFAGVTGVIIALGSMVLVWTVAEFLS